MTDLEAFLRDPAPTREQVIRRVERLRAGPMRPDEIWLAEQVMRGAMPSARPRGGPLPKDNELP